MAETDLPTGTGGSGGRTYLSGVQPRLVQDGASITPIATLRLGGTIPWDTESKQLQCGETVTSNDGEQTHRVNMEMVLTHTQFKRLNQMRASKKTLELESAGYSNEVTFDQLKWDRVEGANGEVLPSGLDSDEPLYEIQLQSQEDQGE